MSLEILDIDRYYSGPDGEIVSLVGKAVGEQISVLQFAQIAERLSGEDYTIAERFFPALRYLFDIIKSQDRECDRVKMTIQLATTMRYAVWKMCDPQDTDPAIASAIQDSCQLFLETCFLIDEVDDRRYLLMGIVAGLGDSDAAKLLHDLGSGYEHKTD
jgi:hypothetical protein